MSLQQGMQPIHSEPVWTRVCGPQGLTTRLPVRPHACSDLVMRSSCRPCSRSLLSHTISHQQHGAAAAASRSRAAVVAAAQHPYSTSSSSSNSSSHMPVQQQQQQQSLQQFDQQQAGTPSAAASAAQRAMPFAALSRVLLTSSNANMFKTLTQRRQPVSGPMGVLLFLATLIAASFAAIRGLLLKRGKSCKTCRGFGLQRCRLCLGSGRVDWAAKLKHFDVCPLCMNRRFIVCAECGGHYHRAMFAHRRRQAGGAFEPDSGNDSSSAGGFGKDSGGFQGPIVLNLGAAGAAAGGVTVVTSGVNVPTGSVNPLLSSMSD